MTRSADYTIKGFQYQFNKTLLDILNSPEGSEITVEGIVEDIDIVLENATKAIQCKYHEANENFTMSTIYKPLLQMMDHFHFRSKGKVDYVLFAHFPNLTNITVTKAHLSEALASKNKALQPLAQKLKDVVNLDAFLARFTSEVGPAYDTLVQQVLGLMAALGMNDIDVTTLVYPNAIQIVAELSIQHNAVDRKITKKALLNRLGQIKSTAISQWTLSLANRRELLKARRNQLKPNLAKNARLRYFLVHPELINDFDHQIVLFIKDYLEKYHYKPTHTITPVFCLNVSEEHFQNIELRLVQKEIAFNDGITANVFNEKLFSREPILAKERKEFLLRLIRWDSHGSLLNAPKADDLFVLGAGGYSGINTEDVSLEELAAENFDEIKYMIGLTDVCK